MAERNETEDGDIRLTRVAIKYNGHEYWMSISIYATEQDRHRVVSGVYQAMREFHKDMAEVSDEVIAQKQLLHTMLDRYPQIRHDPDITKWLSKEFRR